MPEQINQSSAGCDFTCKNENCKCCHTGFTMTSSWAMGKIDDVIKCSNIKFNNTFQKNLSKQKEDGKEFACIIYPNNDNIKTETYRVQMWSPKAKCMWEFYSDQPQSEDDLSCKGKVDLICSQTNCELVGFQKAITDGLDCPFCGEKLEQMRWFAKN